MDALHEELRLDPKFNNIRFTTIYPFYVDTGLARDPKYRYTRLSLKNYKFFYQFYDFLLN